ncbi:MAG: SAM-dependent methyltransferase [Hyphomicrobiaceae bacterium]
MSGHPPYDPEARRATPLASWLIEAIGGSTMPLDTYVHHCLFHEQHGYYTTRTGLGVDFTTSPEISQVFGELLGLWSVAVWQQMGRPKPIRLVELGPGRGTMMRDALRAARLVPEFLAGLRVWLDEVSPAFEALQRETLADCPVPIEWRTDPLADPGGATIILANEYYDCFPIAQTVRQNGRWYERHVAVSEGRLAYRLTPVPAERAGAAEALGDMPDGTVVEHHGFAPACHTVGAIAHTAPVAVLAIDYGHDGNPPGDTLQAMRRHAYEHPLTSPGEADLTSQVPFGALAAAFAQAGLIVDGPATQAEFLGRLGIVERAQRLMHANPARAAEIEAGVARLIAPGGMGTRFKALGARSGGLPTLPGF